MLSISCLALIPLLSIVVEAARSKSFSPPSSSPTTQSSNYTGPSNGTLINSPYVVGKSFDRFMIITLENTDFSAANSSATFRKLAADGVLFDSYYAVTHPSEPNYIAMASGHFHGLGGDPYATLPQNVSTIVDLLEAKKISWASYQENMPYDGCDDEDYTSHNYVDPSAADYTYYRRKHNPLIIHNSVASVQERALRVRNFNDFAADVNANALPQWSFITPNMVDDAHDTDVDFTSAWLEYFLVPLLANPNFNSDRTLIILTFDENDNYAENNRIFTLAVGGAVPKDLLGTTDSTYYSHYSSLSTVEANWGLGSLGRGDTDPEMSNVYSWVASATGYENNGLNSMSTNLPSTNLTGNIPGPLNPRYFVNVLSPNITAIGAGGGPVFVYPGTNTSFTAATAPAPVNLLALGKTSPYFVTTAPYNYAGASNPNLVPILPAPLLPVESIVQPIVF